MWKLFGDSDTEVVLDSAERQLFMLLLSTAWWDATTQPMDEPKGSPVDLIANLADSKQQAYVFHLVGRAMLDQEFASLPTTAWSEAALYHILSRILIEIEYENVAEVIKPLLLEVVGEDAAELEKAIDEDDLDQWLEDHYFSHYFDDYDFLTSVILDADPETAKSVKESLGIDSDYYSTIPPYPSDAQLQEATDWMTKQGMDEVMLSSSQ